MPFHVIASSLRCRATTKCAQCRRTSRQPELATRMVYRERLYAALNEALKDPAVRVRFEEIGAVPIGLELDKARTFLVDEVVKYRDIITKAGIAKIE